MKEEVFRETARFLQRERNALLLEFEDINKLKKAVQLKDEERTKRFLIVAGNIERRAYAFSSRLLASLELVKHKFPLIQDRMAEYSNQIKIFTDRMLKKLSRYDGKITALIRADFIDWKTLGSEIDLLEEEDVAPLLQVLKSLESELSKDAEIEESLKTESRIEEERKLTPSQNLLRVDFHFHPDFGMTGWGDNEKARKIWEVILDKKLDVVAITEHCYKDPGYSFQKMIGVRGQMIQEMEQASKRSQNPLERGVLYNRINQIKSVVALAGMEITCREGVEVVVVQMPPYPQGKPLIYYEDSFKHIRQVFVKEAILIAKQRGYFVYLPHPYDPRVGAFKLLELTKLEKEIKKQHPDFTENEVKNEAFKRREKNFRDIVESYNIAVSAGEGATRVLQEFIKNEFIKRYEFAPGHVAHGLRIVGGSDAHGPTDLEFGNFILIPLIGSRTVENIVKSITNNYTAQIVRGDLKISSGSIARYMLNKLSLIPENIRALQERRKINARTEKSKDALIRIMKDPNSVITDWIDLKHNILTIKPGGARESAILLDLWERLSEKDKEEITKAYKERKLRDMLTKR